MKYQKQKLTFSLVQTLVVLTFYLRSERSFDLLRDGNANAQNRVLHGPIMSYGSYKILDSESVADNCHNVNVTALSDEEEAKAGFKKMNKYFPANRDAIVDGKWSEFLVGNLISLAPPLVFVILSLICCPFQIVWGLCLSFCNCWCCKREKDDEGKETDPHTGCCRGDKCRMYSFIMCLFFLYGMVLIGLVWTIFFGKAVDSLGRVNCGTATIFQDLINGVKLPGSEFAGMKGIEYLLTNIKTEVSAASSGSEAANVTGRNLHTKAGLLAPALTTFYDFWRTDSSANIVTPLGSSVRPDSCTSTGNGILTSTINPAIGTEFTSLAKIGVSLHESCTTIEGLGASAAALTSFQTGQTKTVDMVAKMRESLEKYDTQWHKDLDIGGKRPILILVMLIGILSVAGFASVFQIFLLITHCCKKDNAFIMLCEKIFMILQATAALIFCILSLLIIIVAIMLVNVCYYVDKTYNDTTFSAKLNQATLTSFVNACVYTTSSGKLTDVFDAQSGAAQFVEVTTMLTGFSEFDTFESMYSAVTDPIAMTIYKTNLDGRKDWSIYDWNNAGSNGPKATLTAMDNQVTCAADKFVMNNALCAETGVTNIWQNTDNCNKDTNSPGICIDVDAMTPLCNLNSNRYTGTCADSNKVTIQTYATGMSTFQGSYSTVINNMKGTAGAAGDGVDSNTKANKVAKDLIAEIKLAKTDLDSLKSSLSVSTGLIAAMDGGIDGFQNCTIMRRDLIIFSNTVCYDFTVNFSQTAISFIALGPCMCLLAICMCATIRCPVIKKKDDGSENIDNNKVGPTKTNQDNSGHQGYNQPPMNENYYGQANKLEPMNMNNPYGGI